MCLVLLPSAASAADEPDWSVVQPGTVVVFRHANAPGVGDPAAFKIDDCSTQRNLDDAGRAQALRIGEQFRRRGIVVGAVLSSQWCRARDTATLAFPGQVRDDSALNSFFGASQRGAAQTAAVRTTVAAWRGPGVLVLVTHQVNISALTQVYPASGEGVVLRAVEGGGIEVLGRVRP
jgi:phosphohistidine phosphatase SixA